jgi:hypothetical protein
VVEAAGFSEENLTPDERSRSEACADRLSAASRETSMPILNRPVMGLRFLFKLIIGLQWRRGWKIRPRKEL